MMKQSDLISLKTVFGKRVRVSESALRSGAERLELYNQFGRPLNTPKTQPLYKRNVMVYRENLVLGL